MEFKSSKLIFLYKITPETLKKYEENGVYFKKPRLVAFYEYNYENLTTARRINYFKNPESVAYPMDLNAGFKTYIERNDTIYSKKIEASLKYDMSFAAEIDGVENVDKTKIITRRGTLTQIMECCYNIYYNVVSIRVSRYNGNLYLLLEKSDISHNELKPVETHHAQLEKNLFSDSPNNPPNCNERIDRNIELLGVHRSIFGKYDVIYTGEIQGIISDEEIKDFDDLNALNDCRFVLLKQLWYTLKHRDQKYLKFWLQSYLANVQDVYIGYKNGNGIIDEPIEHKMAGQLPKNRFWKPVNCTGFLYEFLQNVEKCMSSVNCLSTVYVFHYIKKENSFSYEVFNGETDMTFITNEYMEYCKEKSNV